jgi:hypothetical protein
MKSSTTKLEIKMVDGGMRWHGRKTYRSDEDRQT